MESQTYIIFSEEGVSSETEEDKVERRKEYQT